MGNICVVCNSNFEGHALSKLCSDECRKIRSRSISNAWNSANRDRVREGQRLTRKNRIHKAREYDRKRSRTPAGYVDRILERVKKRTPDTDITREFLVSTLTDVCSLSGISYEWEKFERTSFTNPYAPSLDRVDSSKGYYTDNVQWILSILNFAKNEMSMKDFMQALNLLFKSEKLMEALMKESDAH